jgi:CAAX prenyl protease-like protein
MDAQPTNAATPPSRADLWAYVGPFGLFMLLLMAVELVKKLGGGFSSQSLWLTASELWIYPLQTVICGAALFRWRKHYPLGINGRAAVFGALVGVVVLFLWISPQAIFGRAPRTEGGFDPTRLLAADVPHRESLYGAVLLMRFIRLAVVVPILEEIFWRGFLLRYLVREDFTAVPFGTFTRLSFGAVALGFMLEHNPPDYPAALAAGVLYNLVAVRAKNLSACILAHALTNLLLGFYVMRTGQWGFW